MTIDRDSARDEKLERLLASLEESARCLGCAQESHDPDAAAYWTAQVATYRADLCQHFAASSMGARQAEPVAWKLDQGNGSVMYTGSAREAVDYVEMASSKVEVTPLYTRPASAPIANDKAADEQKGCTECDEFGQVLMHKGTPDEWWGACPKCGGREKLDAKLKAGGTSHQAKAVVEHDLQEWINANVMPDDPYAVHVEELRSLFAGKRLVDIAPSDKDEQFIRLMKNVSLAAMEYATADATNGDAVRADRALAAAKDALRQYHLQSRQAGADPLAIAASIETPADIKGRVMSEMFWRGVYAMRDALAPSHPAGEQEEP